MGNVVTIPQKIFLYIENAINDNQDFFKEIDELKNENETLKQKIREYEDTIEGYNFVKSQNDYYKTLEVTKNLYANYDVVIGEIIATSSNNWDNIYLIDKGYDNGIRVNMAVITKEGLVGYIKEVGDKTSKVVAIIDPSVKISRNSKRNARESNN